MTVNVKICGITNLRDACIAVEYGVDALGFNFYKPSPRHVSPLAAAEIISNLPAEVMKVGVFVNSSADEIAEIVSAAGLGAVQLHGDETPDVAAAVKRATGATVIKAIRVSGPVDVDAFRDYPVDAFLFDAPGDSYGGSGKTFHWEAAVSVKNIQRKFYLAGGLTPDNVGVAIRKFRPFGVDVCSGVESAKGIKDLVKVEEFIRNAKESQ